jgi:hypothetical protein
VVQAAHLAPVWTACWVFSVAVGCRCLLLAVVLQSAAVGAWGNATYVGSYLAPDVSPGELRHLCKYGRSQVPVFTPVVPGFVCSACRSAL